MNTEDKLFELQMACRRSDDPLADWVLFAATRHIATGRATRAFLQAFDRYPKEDWPEMIKACLRGDRSDNGIIKTMRAKLRVTA